MGPSIKIDPIPLSVFRAFFHLSAHRFAPSARLRGLVSVGLPIGGGVGGDFAAFIEVPIELFLGLRAPISGLAEIVEGPLETSLEEGVEAAEQVASPKAGAAPRIVEQRLLYVEAAIVLHHPIEQLPGLHRRGLHHLGD